jgi:hypothetical protein
MKFDATRNTFLPGKNYSRVLMQQGRVQLDADWNEQAAIELGFIRQLGADLIGAHGGPVAGGDPPDNAQPAFSVVTFEDTDFTPKAADFLMIPGRYYVDGIPCTNATSSTIVAGYPRSAVAGQITVFTWTLDEIPFQTGQYAWLYCAAPGTTLKPVLVQITAADYANRILTVAGDISTFTNDPNAPNGHFLRRAPTYMTQPDYPAPPLTNDSYQVYLDVWEREVICAQDDSMREVALGGPDTAARARIVAQVKVLPQINGVADMCPTPWELASMLQPPNRGCLAARAKPVQASSDPCTIAPDAMYRGPENQLYRVEIHTGTDASGDSTLATFKWSRENGAVVFPIAAVADPTFTLGTLGRDDRFSLTEGDWVEVVDDDYIALGTPAPLRQVQSIDRVRMTVVLSGNAGGATGTIATKHPMLRRWDQKAGDPGQQGLTLGADNAALIFPQSKAQRTGKLLNIDVEGQGLQGRLAAMSLTSTWFELEDGVQIQFTVPPQSKTAVPQFRTGDYWLIPARVATGNVEWPTETIPGNPTTPIAMLPHGPVHHYAPIAGIKVSDNTVDIEHDCTVVFGIFNGALSFTQSGEAYTPNWSEMVLTAPTEQNAPEVAKPKPVKKQAAAKADDTAKK